MKVCLKCKKEFGETNEPCPYDGGKHIHDHLLGTVIDGKYQLEKCVGRGGMGAVYLGHHIGFNKKVAVKVLLQSLVESNPAAFDRFRREAQATGRIKHPNAVSVTDFGQTDDGTSFLVMEYVDGVSLRRLLDRSGGKLVLDRFLFLAKQICAGIAAAHKAGVIHRDIKPDNVMIEIIDNQEVARVLDFGIAKLRDSQQQTNLTETGALLGTPNYMSPEQCSGNKIDHRTDIYSLGVMFYQMLSGELPFKASSAPALIVMHVTQPPKPIREIAPDIPEILERVIMQTLEKNPENRQRSVAELVEQLEAALNPEANQWRIVFNGILDTGDSTRARLLQGLQQGFNMSASQAEQLITSKGVNIKKTRLQKDANHIAEKLRNIGANVKVESIVGEQLITKPQSGPLLVFGTETNEPTVDPLLETDSYKMLSYVSEKAKPNTGQLAEEQQTINFSTPLTKQQPIEKPTADHQGASTQQPNTNNLPDDASSTIIMGKPTPTGTIPIIYKVEVEGQTYDAEEKQVEDWLWEGRLTRADKISRANGQWFEINTVPKFRRILDQIEAQSAEAQEAKIYAKQTVTPQSTIDNTAFLTKMAVVGAVVLGIYITVNLVFQYYLYTCVSEDTYFVLINPKINLTLLRSKIQERLKDRSLYIPDESIAINANFEKKQVAISINYKRPLLFVPIRYKVERQSTINLTMDQILQVKKEDQIELAGITQEQIEEYRKKKAEEEAEKAKNNPYTGERPLNERDGLILELQKGEFGILPSQNLIKQAVRAQQEK